ncbi:hypothetical protein A5821_001154 [Enterococcus sp. 7F3_DIV0205]|uniref:Uncharacterized protein n=1 Tax=Candidatus Enterococcus palustris TaxID=1834189 RepID=A0AAQ3W784_9ENTE|nr:hypothetical protein [Enterococcus sp. 7F3_DIV0205]OTN85551.1 hypothetical protein A5821_001497 [Enterococcus sp. 7F3_DIV0205]
MEDFFEKVADEINHEYEPGIGAEIRSFVEYQGEDIKESNLSFDRENEIFILKVSTNELEKEAIQQLFMKLVFFLEYPNATFYTTNQTDKSLHYRLISYTKKNIGFVLDVEFF